MDYKMRRLVVLLYTVALTISSWYSTQKIAKTLNYQDALYWVMYTGDDFKIYFPFAWVGWWRSFSSKETEWLFTAYGFKIFSFSLLFLTFGILATRFLIKPKITDSHGSAHFSTLDEIKEIEKKDPPGLLAGKGVFLGNLPSGEYLRDDTKTHVLVCAPTRSGKGVGIIIPTLLTWEHSVVVTDIKGENWALTSGWRKTKIGSLVFKFDPTNAFSSKYNPFDEIRVRTPYEIRDLQNIVNILVDPTGKGTDGDQAHWIKSAAALLSGVVMHLKYLKPNMNISDVLDFFYGDANTSIQDKFMFCISEPENIKHDPSGEIFKKLYNAEPGTTFHPIVKQYFNKMANTPDKEFGSIMSTLDTILDTYRDPVIASNMVSSDFLMQDVMDNDKPVSLYLVFPPSDLDRVKPLFRVIVELLYRRNTETMDFIDGKNVERKHRLLMLLDEFPALGKLETYEKAMAFIAGYGIKSLIITQDINQIEKLYTQANSIVSNCQVQVYHTPTDLKTPKFIADMMGNKTIQTKSYSYNGALINLGSRNISVQESARQLMTADEVKTMDKNKELIFVAGFSPILADKIKYYENPHFKERVHIEAPKETDVISHQNSSDFSDIPDDFEAVPEDDLNAIINSALDPILEESDYEENLNL